MSRQELFSILEKEYAKQTNGDGDLFDDCFAVFAETKTFSFCIYDEGFNPVLNIINKGKRELVISIGVYDFNDAQKEIELFNKGYAV